MPAKIRTSVYFYFLERIVSAIGNQHGKKGAKFLSEQLRNEGVEISTSQIKRCIRDKGGVYKFKNLDELLGSLIRIVKDDQGLMDFVADYRERTGKNEENCRDLMCPQIVSRLTAYSSQDDEISNILEGLKQLDSSC